MALQTIPDSYIAKIENEITSNWNKQFAPIPIEIKRIYLNVKNSEHTIDTRDNNNSCAYCDGIGLIPYTLKKHGRRFIYYGLKCDCTAAEGMKNRRYFEVFPAFEFSYPNPEYPGERYIDCFNRNYNNLVKDWKNESVLDIESVPL